MKKQACTFIENLTTNLRPRVNFTNALSAAFTITDPKSAKRQSCHQCLFTLLGPVQVKALSKMLMKLTPNVMLQPHSRLNQQHFGSKRLEQSHFVFQKVGPKVVTKNQSYQTLNYFLTNEFVIPIFHIIKNHLT